MLYRYTAFGMEDNGTENMANLGGSQGAIQTALDALKQKKSSVDQVELIAVSGCFEHRL